MSLEQQEVMKLIQETTKLYISPVAEVTAAESRALQMGYQAVSLQRHHVQFEKNG